MGKIGMRHTLVSTIKPQGEVANLIPQKRERGEEGVCSVIAGRLTLLRNDKVDDSTFRFSARENHLERAVKQFPQPSRQHHPFFPQGKKYIKRVEGWV